MEAQRDVEEKTTISGSGDAGVVSSRESECEVSTEIDWTGEEEAKARRK
jgi:hypothetical protein